MKLDILKSLRGANVGGGYKETFSSHHKGSVPLVNVTCVASCATAATFATFDTFAAFALVDLGARQRQGRIVRD